MKHALAGTLAVLVAGCASLAPDPKVIVVPVCPVVQVWSKAEFEALAAALAWLETMLGPEGGHVRPLVRAEAERQNLRAQAKACRDHAKGQGS